MGFQYLSMVADRTGQGDQWPPDHGGGNGERQWKRMGKLDRAMATLNEKRIPYYDTAAAFAMDRKNPAKKQAYADAIGELRAAFNVISEAQGK